MMNDSQRNGTDKGRAEGFRLSRQSPSAARIGAWAGIFLGLANFAAEFFLGTDIVLRWGRAANPRIYPPMGAGMLIMCVLVLAAIAVGKLETRMCRTPRGEAIHSRLANGLTCAVICLATAAVPLLVAGLVFLPG